VPAGIRRLLKSGISEAEVANRTSMPLEEIVKIKSDVNPSA
jgi:hypothetical protein